MWGEWIAGLRTWHLFGGLTFDPKRYVEWDRWSRSLVPRQMAKEVAEGRFKRWVREQSRSLNRRVEYVAAVEYHRNGWPHIHPLLDVGELYAGDIAQLGTSWYEANGYCKLEEPQSFMAVCSYAAKYLSKDLMVGDVLLSAGLAGSRSYQMRLGGRRKGRGEWERSRW